MSDEAGPPSQTPDWEELQQGVRKCITKEGTNPKVYAAPGMEVCVHYTGTLTNGSKFDSSKDRGQPFQFTIGVGQVIKGWDEGMARMSVGQVAKLTCTPDYAYGERGFPPVIPPASTLIFEVELLGVK